MAHIGRTVKNVEAPRPLKSQSRSSIKNNYMLIEELIQLIENVALSLQSGINNTEPMAALVQNLRIHGPQLETVSKDTLDRAFVVFRNASQDERLNIMTRLNLLELIELRAKGWEDNGFNSYYKTKQVTNIELPDGTIDLTRSGYLSTSPTFGGTGTAAAAAAAAIAAVGSAQQTQLLLAQGEVIRNSGKFPKPTKIPGKTYCKDEVVIRNADSGKVNPGAKERLVQITGPTEEKINYAKQLIEDTIRRNASPVRLEPNMGGSHVGGGGGSCSSLASSNSDDAVTTRTPGVGSGAGNSNLTNRLSFNSAQNFMTASGAVAAAVGTAAAQQQQVINMMGAVVGNTSTPTAAAAAAVAGKVLRPNQQMLLHSFSTNDASLGEYKYTVNVGQHLIKITGDCCDLVRVAKLVLDDYFSSAEFLASVEAGAAFDGSIVSPISTPSTPMAAPQFMMGTPLHAAAPPLADSGIGLNYMATAHGANSALNDGDDEVFTVDANAANQSNGLARSRRSHFSRKDSTPEAANNSTTARGKDNPTGGTVSSDSTRIVHEYEHLLYYAKSPHSWALPVNWQKICEKFPAIVRNKVTKFTTTTSTVTNTTAPILRVASINTKTATSTSNSIAISDPTPSTNSNTCMTTANTPNSHVRNIVSNNNNNNNITYNNATSSGNNIVSANVTTSCLSMPIKNTNNMLVPTHTQQPHHQQPQQQQIVHMHPSNSHGNNNRQQIYEFQTSLHIKRKGFFNRQIVSIDEEGYDALQQQQIQQQYTTERYYCSNTTNGGQSNNSYYRSYGQRADINANQQQIQHQQHLQNQQFSQQSQQNAQYQQNSNCPQRAQMHPYPRYQQNTQSQPNLHYQRNPQNQQFSQYQNNQQNLQYQQNAQNQQHPQNQHHPHKIMSVRTGLTTAGVKYANQPLYSVPPTNNISATFNNGNSNSGNSKNNKTTLDNVQTNAPNENEMRNSVELNKTNKMISSSVKSTHNKDANKTNSNSNKPLELNSKNPFIDQTAHSKSRRQMRCDHINNDVVEVIDVTESDADDVEFVCETKYIKPEISVTTDIVGNQRRASERPKFMRSNSTCD